MKFLLGQDLNSVYGAFREIRENQFSTLLSRRDFLVFMLECLATELFANDWIWISSRIDDTPAR
jgi:hypothetical protein